MVLKYYFIYYFTEFCCVQVCYKGFFPWTMNLKAKLD